MTNMDVQHDVIVIGAGIAGLVAGPILSSEAREKP
jgi:succinate dehydrogenase/fumarate reductase flavoprotein subunit